MLGLQGQRACRKVTRASFDGPHRGQAFVLCCRRFPCCNIDNPGPMTNGVLSTFKVLAEDSSGGIAGPGCLRLASLCKVQRLQQGPLQYTLLQADISCCWGLQSQWLAAGTFSILAAAKLWYKAAMMAMASVESPGIREAQTHSKELAPVVCWGRCQGENC